MMSICSYTKRIVNPKYISIEGYKYGDRSTSPSVNKSNESLKTSKEIALCEVSICVERMQSIINKFDHNIDNINRDTRAANKMRTGMINNYIKNRRRIESFKIKFPDIEDKIRDMYNINIH